MSRRKLLLTGAGFTANFGAPLAWQMWNWLYGAAALREQVELLEKLRLNNQDFERVYFEAMTGAYRDDQKAAMAKAMLQAFRDMDDIIRTCMRHRLVNTYALDDLIASFSGTRGTRGYFFTLNQDLYVERWYVNGERPLLPGLPPNAIWRNPLAREAALAEADYVKVPDEPGVEEHKARLGPHDTFAYLKLHGSANWLRPTGQAQMVIGAQKEESIQAEPLLRWYMQMFRDVLHEPNRLLLIIGYGFGDAHINAIIAHAVQNAGLKFVVVSPGPIASLLKRFELGPHWDILPRGLAGHIPFSLQEIFPPAMNCGMQLVTSAGWQLLKRDFFDQAE